VCADAGLVVPTEAGPTAALYNSASSDAATPDRALESRIKDTVSKWEQLRGAIKAIKSDDDKAMRLYGCSKNDLSDLVGDKAILQRLLDNLLLEQGTQLKEKKLISLGNVNAQQHMLADMSSSQYFTFMYIVLAPTHKYLLKQHDTTLKPTLLLRLIGVLFFGCLQVAGKG
jgi:hypothetical protein